MNKFDVLVEELLNLNEGRRPKIYEKFVLDFDKIESDIESMSDSNPFKNIYKFAVNGLKEYAPNQYFTNDEMANEAKTLPEWESSIFSAFSGQSLSNKEKKQFSQRFFSFLRDPDREYFSVYYPEKTDDQKFTNMEEHIYNFINNSEQESTPKSEVLIYISKYGYEDDEINSVISKMINDGQLAENDEGNLITIKDPSLDDLEPDDSELSLDDSESLLDDSEVDDSRPEEDPEEDLNDIFGINDDEDFEKRFKDGL